MKFSCLPVSLFQDIQDDKISIQQWASIAADSGLDAIDLSILLIKNRTPVYLEKLIENLDQTGMQIAMITTYPDFTHPDFLQRERELSYLIADIAAASQLRARFLRITAGQDYRNPDCAETLDTVADYFVRAREWAEKFGVRLIFENHSKPGAWSKPDFLFDTRMFLRLAEKLKNSGIGINFDTANTLAYGDDPIEVFYKVLPQVETIHVADIAAARGMKFTSIGTGAAPIREIFSIAKSSGFNGWVCIEEASNHGIEGVRRAVEYVKEAWEKA